jgi:predicted ATPase
VQELNLKHEELFRSFSYLGPLRQKADRLYTWTGIEPESVGYSGENTIAAILAARKNKRMISPGYKKQARPFEEIIAQNLKGMGLIESFKVDAISERRQEYEVKVCTKGSNDPVDLPDVGFGISQVLPVLTQIYYAPIGSIIIMEQPEIHLHPSAQSALADVMIAAVNSREKGFDRNIQLIIETHSEHFLRKLQRRIAENIISPEKVSAYFADASTFPMKLEPLQINLYGNIQNWPENFFGDEMEDIAKQAEAAAQKRIDHVEPSKQEGTPNG